MGLQASCQLEKGTAARPRHFSGEPWCTGFVLLATQCNVPPTCTHTLLALTQSPAPPRHAHTPTAPPLIRLRSPRSLLLHHLHPQHHNHQSRVFSNMLLKQQQQRAAHSSAAHTAPTPPRHTTPAHHTRGALVQQHQQQRCVRVHSSAEELVVRPTTPAGASSSSSSSQVDQFSQLKQGIARFYNESSGLWESVWGEHMHHGYYPQGAAPKSNAQAQIDMIDETLRWAGVTRVKAMVDVGCGIGGSSRHISRQFGCTSRGITLSPVQAARANELSAAAGLGERCSFQVADALQQPFADDSFDLVWSMESGEHMPEKERFVNELCRVAAPGGRIIIVTWCHRVLAPGEAGLKPHEQALLSKICEAYYLPAWCSVADYERLFEANGLQDIRIADWSNEVAPFWGEVVKSAMTGQGIMGLLKAGWTTIKGALVMPMMAQGFRMGLIKFNLITATVPAQKKK